MNNLRQFVCLVVIVCISTSISLAQKNIENNSQQKIKTYQKLKPDLFTQKASPRSSVINHNVAEAHWTTRNTGDNELTSMLIEDVFIDEQGRQFFISNTAVDIYDGTDWSHLDYGKDIPYPVNDIIQGIDDQLIMLTTRKVYWMSSSLNPIDSVSIDPSYYVSNNYEAGVVDSDDRLWLAHAPEYLYNQQNEPVLNQFGSVTVVDLNDGSYLAHMDSVSHGLEGSIQVEGVNDMALSSDGDVWASVAATDSTPGGVVVFDSDLNSASTFQGSNSNIPSMLATDVEQGTNGNMWVAFSDSTQRTAYYDGSSWATFTNADITYPCIAFERASNNQIYCGNDSTTVAYDGSNWNQLQENADGQSFSNISAITSNPDGDMAFVKRNSSNRGILRSGVFVNDGSGYNYISTHNDNGLFSNTVFGLSADNEGGLWVTGFRGAGYYDGSDWTYYNAEDGMATSYSWRVQTASNGTVWFGSSEQGVTYLENDEFKTYTEHGSFAEAIFEDSNQNIWMGSFVNNGILQYDGSEFTHHDTLAGVIGIYVTSFAEGPDGNIYAGVFTSNQNPLSIAKYDGNEWTAWRPDSTEQFDPMEIASDKDNNIWFSGDSLAKWDGNTITEIAYPRDNFYMTSNHIEPDPEGNIWITYGSEVWVYNTTSSEWVNPISNLENSAFIIEHDNQGNTWVGTYGGGLYQFNRSQAVPNEMEQELPESFTLKQNYPNPFNPTTNITYDLPQAVNGLTVKVFNILGKEVATLVNAQNQQAGQHTVTFDASGLSSGVYIYRVQSSAFSASRKMMLIK